jgi:hypothetical protein
LIKSGTNIIQATSTLSITSRYFQIIQSICKFFANNPESSEEARQPQKSYYKKSGLGNILNNRFRYFHFLPGSIWVLPVDQVEKPAKSVLLGSGLDYFLK